MRFTIPGLMIVALSCLPAVGQVAQPQVAQPQVTQPQFGQPQAAQPRTAQPIQQAQLQQTQAGRTATSDQELAAAIYGGCHNEVELAKFAQSRLESREGKEFAQQMIKDHQADCEAYAKLAGNLVASGQPAAGQATAGSPGGHANWVNIHRELAQQCLQTTQKELSQKQGQEFDQCYLMQQAMAHHEMKDKLTVLRKHASPALAQQIDKSLEVVNSHLEHAKKLAKSFDDNSSERVSRRDDK